MAPPISTNIYIMFQVVLVVPVPAELSPEMSDWSWSLATVFVTECRENQFSVVTETVLRLTVSA
jgi:hypothetical protein